MPLTIKTQKEDTQKEKTRALSPDSSDKAAMEKIRSNTNQTDRYKFYRSVTPTLRSGILSSVTQTSPPHSPVDEEKPNKNFIIY
ncbi:MAG: hypothetical protein ACYCQI_08155 [Gammaproteobacteria bacterium]